MNSQEIETRRYLFFDTETTGLPRDYKAPSSNTANWPRLVQLSWIITDGTGKKLSVKDYIVYPDGFIIPEEASNVHGIDTQRALDEGSDVKDVLKDFLDDYEVCDCIVGHNISFDKKIIGAELVRLGRRDVMEDKPSICTMHSSIDFCHIPGRYGYKYPRLQELHKKLFGTCFEDAHNSLSDVTATLKCFWELVRIGLI